METLLAGKRKRGSDYWDKKYGEEPELHDIAVRFGARITEINDKGILEYIAASPSKKVKCRVSR